ncbi:pyridoxamine 5'-phosphate oxidase [Coxiella endosymbiont of Amblyomma sculptum]|uniref:pyridoxamine 5'-phosphate oxidase n=1 Tax=Coxiella endosymbiont of Amblyomma sculptum TaxID=2487929 RepID=UPI00132EEC6A|nr:pyridoxamine 5'-phosphate oxidase [Coxiella endosymbiont of Amblyomma sculptum]QHG92565.1 pyridoxamine 5'-phosphate oxidase [Coxiella endosymbiont of Amblyomma sculptum]
MFRSNFLDNPLEQFELWYKEAQKEHTADDPSAMTLATANSKGKPTARTVLFKGISGGGLLFFTNYYSRKAKDLSENPNAAWVFYWPKIYKQVCGEGYVKKLARKESETYFETRPYESQINAWISEQSQEIPNRGYLIDRHQKYRKNFPEKVYCPEFWGGFRLIPIRMEFWIGKKHRLHDRILYLRQDDREWKIIRLAP